MLVPPAVWADVVAQGIERPGAVAVRSAPRIRPRRLAADEPVRTLGNHIGAGEAEAIALVSERTGPVLLRLDDRKGRRGASARGLVVTGSAGVRLLAKRRRLISTVRPLLEALREPGRYLDPTATDAVLTRAGEAPS